MHGRKQHSESTENQKDSSDAQPSQVGCLAALADRTRLRILTLLSDSELAIGEIALVLGQSQPRVSRHIRILAEAGLIERRREGSWVFLRLAKTGSIAALLRAVHGLARSEAEMAAETLDKERLFAVQAERTAAAERYFATHADEWDAMRRLHIAETEVESAMLRLMHNRRLGHMLDIGTGTGRMVEIFGGKARMVTALDRSPEMLRIARTKLAGLMHQQQVPLELVQSDFYALPLPDDAVDSIILHQVLHFAQQPDRVIAEAARVLRDGGHLLIADFASHSLEDLRTKAAHARLGFSDAQIRGWFASNRLQLEAVDSLPAPEQKSAGSESLTVRLWLGRRRSADARSTAPQFQDAQFQDAQFQDERPQS
jgi:ubiquinone/menaquinone biosynthesis C-methylase UbiE/DNA-binding transcriptional ArsR family regulator